MFWADIDPSMKRDGSIQVPSIFEPLKKGLLPIFFESGRDHNERLI